MKHQDLTLWQATRETTPSRVGAGALQLVGQNQQRVLLMIGYSGTFQSWLSTRQPISGGRGLPIGVNESLTTDSQIGAADATEDAGPPITITWNNWDTTGNVSGLTSAPATYRFTASDDGVLAQSEWWAWDIAGGALYYVLEVIQERDPERPCPGDPYARSLSRGLWQPHRSTAVSSGRYHLDPPMRPQPAPLRPATVTQLDQSLLDLLRRHRRCRRRVHGLSG